MKKLPSVLLAIAASTLAIPAAAQDGDMEARFQLLEQRLQALEAQNSQLRAEIEVRDNAAAQTPIATPRAAPQDAYAGHANNVSSEDSDSQGFVGTNSSYAYEMLDHAENVTTKSLVQLEALASGELRNKVTLSGGTTVLMNQQWSNRPDKFGYLMRHPTSGNQRGKSVSEAVIHSAHLAVTAKLSDDFSSYAELLYDPEQSFGAGTNTALARNQVQLRQGWIMFGNLNKRPVYALVGKMYVPFGLNDTVSPFTNSTNWHAFAGLAYGAQVGVKTGGLSVRAMAVQGGSQFRGANAPVNGTSVPSKLNNFAVDGSYTLSLDGNGNSVKAGASYLHGSAYCQSYPVVHFNPCVDNNPAYSAYGKINYGPLTVLGEFAQTTKVWPGSAVPDQSNPLSQFAAQKTQAFTVGARLGFGKSEENTQGAPLALSAEFSKFRAGADGAPWERQNQVVLGLSWFAAQNINLFSELTHVDGYAPLNFVSGGNFPDGSTWSDRDAATNVALVGAQVAF
ncbi:MAG: hypothetical protein WAT93_13485 [Pontixanthobacter sp.]